jgi:hypothetical protein
VDLRRPLIKAADMLIARRADTKARTDFATWKMMAKLNGASALPAEAQDFLANYKGLLDNKMPEAQATETTINLMYRSYYAEMGGHGIAPDIQSQPKEPVKDNVTAFRRPTPQRARNKTGPSGPRRLPVALIFMCLVVVYVGFRYLWR